MCHGDRTILSIRVGSNRSSKDPDRVLATKVQFGLHSTPVSVDWVPRQ